MPRPDGYTEAMAAILIERIREGESLQKICGDPDMPNRGTVYEWLEGRQDFADRYARAREQQAHALADLAINMAHKVDRENSSADKVRLDAIRWVTGKLNPKAYGEKLDLTAKGDGGGPLVVVVKKMGED